MSDTFKFPSDEEAARLPKTGRGLLMVIAANQQGKPMDLMEHIKFCEKHDPTMLSIIEKAAADVMNRPFKK